MCSIRNRWSELPAAPQRREHDWLHQLVLFFSGGKEGWEGQVRHYELWQSRLADEHISWDLPMVGTKPEVGETRLQCNM